MDLNNILVTGGAGYIGNAICWALHDAGLNPVILDSLSAGEKKFTEDFRFVLGDIADERLVQETVKAGKIDAVIHCAALTEVPASLTNPLEFYSENISKTVSFLRSLQKTPCRRILFSSSAALYGNTSEIGVTENSPVGPISPYGRTKWMTELILEDSCRAYGFSAVSLRYFNPIGADPRLRTGPYRPVPLTVLGKIMNALKGDATEFTITGTDYDTPDGTGIRDYVHVWDVALAHVAVIRNFTKAVSEGAHEVFNIGMGRGISVRELVAICEKVIGRKLAVSESPRRPGDIPGFFAVTEKIKNRIGWSSALSVEDGVRSAWEWLEKNG